ncbi:MAG: caspase family protein [Bacteroidales bacterium]|nr:caspase family protein [Bacteroidales bacterium]
MKRLAVILLVILAVATAMAANRALLVGISDYGNPRGNHPDRLWKDIHGANDVALLMPTLQAQGFECDTLTNRRATKKAILAALDAMAKKTGKGDLVYLHFSMHGQLVDEAISIANKQKDPIIKEFDGWDEALIPFDAKKVYKAGEYQGENHLIDDELRGKVEAIRWKVGTDGFVYVVLDACHAGSSAKGDEPVRGSIWPLTASNQPKTDNAEKPLLKPYTHPGQAPVLYIEACKSRQANKEIKQGETYYGSLSWYINDVLRIQKLSRQPSWVKDVKRRMDKFREDQTMTTEPPLSEWKE